MTIPSYVYKITLKSSGQFYFGSRTANVRYNRPPDRDLWICYFTSSSTLKQLIKEFGTDAFDAEVIYTDDDNDAVYWYEQSIIKEHIHNPQCLNKKYQDRLSGDTIFSTAGKPSWNKGRPSPTKGIPRSPEIVAKISANRKGKGLGVPSVNKGVPMSPERYKQHMEAIASRDTKGTKNHFYGKTHSNEVKALIAANTSRAQKGQPKPKHACPCCGRLFAAHVLNRHLATHDASR